MTDTGTTRARVRHLGRRGRDAVNRLAVRAAGKLGLGSYVVLDYPTSSSPTPRRRVSGPLFDIVEEAEEQYRQTLRAIAAYEQDLARIPRRAADGRSPSWINGFLPGLDGASIYGLLRARGPRTYIEVGSGNSTRFARRAIEDGELETTIVSIDPDPRASVVGLCDEAITEPLECASSAAFDDLQSGDVVFLDGSHRVFTGSDATVFFLDLLPSFPPGVLVGVHDVCLPDDYPAAIADRHYSEQYLLAALLIGRPDWIRLVFAADYVSKRPELAGELQTLWGRPEMVGVETHGVAFWFETQTGTG